MLDEVVRHLAPAVGDVIVDGTFGAGGYTRAILAAARCCVIGLDRDPTAIAAGAELVAASDGRLTLVESAFGDMAEVIPPLLASAAAGATPDSETASSRVAGVVLDIGVSSMQLDQPERGFSFQADGPLDMRMGASGPAARDIVEMASEQELADILFHLGEERQARRIARAIVTRRAETPIETTRQLAALVERTIGRGKGDERHPATRTFQALRIHVNDELGELARGLAAAERLLAPGGRLVVVTFHSLEDRVVKRFLARRAKPEAAGSRHAPPSAAVGTAPEPSFRLVNQKPLHPDEREVAANPRARSAKLRAAVRTERPPWPAEAPQALGMTLGTDAHR
jgi:16S rRNA (cytosine1402-N4)-methyltransferase